MELKQRVEETVKNIIHNIDKRARSSSSSSLFYFIFFFQAEDGIRGVAVTGVQTCALPIYNNNNNNNNNHNNYDINNNDNNMSTTAATTMANQTTRIHNININVNINKLNKLKPIHRIVLENTKRNNGPLDRKSVV